MGWSGKSVLITGAASGFGRLLALKLAGKGARLALGDRNEAGLMGTAEAVKAEGADCIAQPCDVSRESEVRSLVEDAAGAHGGLHVAYNNAGVAHDMARLPEISLEEFNRQMAVNAGGVFLGMKYQLPIMAEQGGGAICNTASAAGLVGSPMISAYAAAKHAVIGLTRTAADEFARKNVRVNAICPSFTDTEMLDDLAERWGVSKDEAHQRITSRVPMRRVGTAEEIVQAMIWVCSDENSFMTGQAVSLDGGLTAI